MQDTDSRLGAARAAVDSLVAVAERAGPGWATPTAPGKWSPSQIVEHVAIALEESANVAAGAPSKFPTFPFFIRPLVRTLFFTRTLKNGVFPRGGKAAKGLNPAAGPLTPAAARTRLEGAFDKFRRECLALAATHQMINHPIFGTVSPADYARFQELHILHHCKQMPG